MHYNSFKYSPFHLFTLLAAPLEGTSALCGYLLVSSIESEIPLRTGLTMKKKKHNFPFTYTDSKEGALTCIHIILCFSTICNHKMFLLSPFLFLEDVPENYVSFSLHRTWTHHWLCDNYIPDTVISRMEYNFSDSLSFACFSIPTEAVFAKSYKLKTRCFHGIIWRKVK